MVTPPDIYKGMCWNKSNHSIIYTIRSLTSNSNSEQSSFPPDESLHGSIVSEREEQKCFLLQADSYIEPPEVINWVPLLITGLKGTKIHILFLLLNLQHKHLWILH